VYVFAVLASDIGDYIFIFKNDFSIMQLLDPIESLSSDYSLQGSLNSSCFLLI